MPNLNIRLLGKLQIFDRELVPIQLDAQRAQELFCYLLLHREKAHLRENIAGLLSEDMATTKANKCLSQALWQIKSVLDARYANSANPLILVNSDYIQINPHLKIWVDVSEFKKAYTLSCDVPGIRLDKVIVQTMSLALDLYQGDLLEGCYQEWCLFERERLQNMYLSMLVKLTGYYKALKQYEIGIALCQKVLELEPAHERAHRQMMRLFYLAGNRTGALRQYENCVNALQEELGVRPAKTTENVYKEICADNWNELAIPRVSDQQGGEAILTSLLVEMQNLQTDLANIQRNLEQNMHKVQQIIANPSTRLDNLDQNPN